MEWGARDAFSMSGVAQICGFRGGPLKWNEIKPHNNGRI